MNSNNPDGPKIYVKPSVETLEIDIEGSILTASSTGEGVNPEDTDF